MRPRQRRRDGIHSQIFSRSPVHLAASSLWRAQRQGAPPTAINEVNDQSDCQPPEKPNPILQRQAGHEQEAGEDRKNRNPRHQRHAKAAWPVRLGLPENQNRNGNEQESKQATDVGKVRERPDMKNSGGDSDKNSGNPRRDARTTEQLVQLRARARKETVG